MKINFLVLFLTILNFCFSQQNIEWRVDQNKSLIKYSGNHILHSWEGFNDKIYGLGIPKSNNQDLDKLAILIYVRDFDSNNSGRDAHSLEVLEAIKFPEIKFYSDKINTDDKKVFLNGSFDFHGVKIKKDITANLKDNNKTLEISGNLYLKLSDFKIKLPSFLSIKIDDLVEINYTIVLNK